MDTIIRSFLVQASFGAALGSIILGLVIGATYGWRGRADPRGLFVVGTAFIVMLGVYGYLDTAIGIGAVGTGAARFLNWCITILAIIAGQSARLRIELWRTDRRRAQVQRHQ
jgi:hypothetical protein